MSWQYYSNGKLFGPVSETEVWYHISNGSIKPTDKVKPPDEDWITASEAHNHFIYSTPHSPESSHNIARDSNEKRPIKAKRWAKYIFLVVVIFSGVKLLFAFAHGDYNSASIALVQIVAIGPILALLAYCLGWIFGKSSAKHFSQSSISANKSCSYCSEVVDYDANKCRHCGSKLKT